MKNSKKKIALLIATFNGGGAERMMINIANGLHNKGEQVSIIVIQGKGVYRKLINPKIPIYDLNKPKTILSIWACVKVFNKIKPRVVLSTQQNVNTLNVIASFLSNCKPKTLLREANTPSVHKTSSIITNRLIPFFYRQATGLVAVSEGVKDDMIMFYGLNTNKVKVIYNPVVNEDLLNKSKEFCNHPFFLEEKPIIISAGRILQQKGFDTLLKAFAKVVEKIDARLIILGDTVGNDDLLYKLKKIIKEKNIEKKVSFPGFVDNPFSYFKNANLFVLSSRYEGLPGVLIQAMACGCPVVSTDCPSGPREILVDNKIGKLVEVDNIVQMSNAIVDALLKTSLEQKEIVKQRANFFSFENGILNYHNTILNL